MYKIGFLIVFFIGLGTMQAQDIINKGILKIQPGTDVYFGGNYTNDATHTNDGNLHLVGDFTNNGTTSVPTSGTTYFDSATNTTQTIDGSSKEIHFYNLTVNNTTTGVQGLAVSDAYDLEVENDLVLTRGKLRLMGEAQLIQTKMGVSGNSGLGHLLIDQQGAKNSTRYNYWSSPVQNDSGIKYTINGATNTVIKDGSAQDNSFSPADITFTTALDGTNGGPIALSTRWMYKYINGDIDPYNDDGWISLFVLGSTTPNTTPADAAELKPGEGFSMKGTLAGAAYAAEQNYSFEGKPNDGDYTLTISADKEYLVGNPYPSALDANQFIDDNIDEANGFADPVIDGTLYYWHHWSTTTHYYTQYGAGYAEYTKAGGLPATLHPDFTSSVEIPNPSPTTIPKQYIPVGQSFNVRSDFTSGGPITFNNGQRAFMLEGANSIPVKNTNQVTARIRLGYEGPNKRHRYLLHAFTNNAASDDFDFGYDGQMIDVGPNDMYFSIYGENSFSKPYTIQGVGAYNIDAEYPLTVKTATPGSHTIMIDDLENFNEPLYILDEKGNTHNLRDSDYVFYSQSNETQRHFKLVFKPQSTADVQDNLNSFVHVFYSDEEIVIRNTNNISLTGFEVYNTIGQLVLQINDLSLLADEEVRIPFANFAQSAYILKLHAEIGNGNYKFINY